MNVFLIGSHCSLYNRQMWLRRAPGNMGHYWASRTDPFTFITLMHPKPWATRGSQSRFDPTVEDVHIRSRSNFSTKIIWNFAFLKHWCFRYSRHPGALLRTLISSEFERAFWRYRKRRDYSMRMRIFRASEIVHWTMEVMLEWDLASGMQDNSWIVYGGTGKINHNDEDGDMNYTLEESLKLRNWPTWTNWDPFVCISGRIHPGFRCTLDNRCSSSLINAPRNLQTRVRMMKISGQSHLPKPIYNTSEGLPCF